MDFFAPALEKYTVSLLTRIAFDYNLPVEEFVAKYSSKPVKVPKKPPKIPAEDRPICPSLTGKKTPCKNRCLPGSDKCHLHSVTLPTGEPKPPKPPRVPKIPKMPKVQPTHNHAPLVSPDVPCQLCDSHGDATSPGLTNVQFESNQNGMSLQDRLRMIIQMEEPEPEPEPESPGAIRHRMILAEQGLPPPVYDEDDDEDSESNGELTEDENEFSEEELLM